LVFALSLPTLPQRTRKNGAPFVMCDLDFPSRNGWTAASQNGTCSNAFKCGSKSHTAAKAETTGYARACRRAFDSRPRCRLRSAVWCPVPRRRALATRFQ
jgi:hypothetical protein